MRLVHSRSSPAPGVRSGRADSLRRLVEEDQVVELHRRLPREEFLACLDGSRLEALDGADLLFFRVMPERSSARRKAEWLTLVSYRELYSAARSASVASGLASRTSIMRGHSASPIQTNRTPPIGSAAIAGCRSATAVANASRTSYSRRIAQPPPLSRGALHHRSDHTLTHFYG
jgi:hypothetical protein